MKSITSKRWCRTIRQKRKRTSARFPIKLAAATISRDKTRALIYYGEMDGMSTQIAGLCDGIYAVSWFDPRTGETEKAENR